MSFNIVDQKCIYTFMLLNVGELFVYHEGLFLKLSPSTAIVLQQIKGKRAAQVGAISHFNSNAVVYPVVDLTVTI